MKIELKEIKIVTSVFIGYNQNANIIINSDNEGKLLENIAWAPLQSVFSDDIYKNPQVFIKGRIRELTDILAYYQNGIFLIETKSLSTNYIVDDNIDNHIDKLKKHIKKALKQIVGAKKVIEMKEMILSIDKKTEIPIMHTDNPIHGIILVENIYPFGHWDDITNMIYQTIMNEHMFLHIMDLAEYMKLIKYSKGRIELIDYNLMERCKLFVNTRNIFIRSRLK